MRITFFGAARSVTGSLHALEVGGATVVLECGLFQGRRAEAFERNRQLPSRAVGAAAVLLSHAHIDHSGNLPGLVRAGFRGTIHATDATVDLAEVMLRDSGHIQESDAAFLRRTKGAAIEPLYTVADVERALPRFAGHAYGAWFDAAPGVRARFLDAGHILGSSVVEIEATEGSVARTVVFTGDYGRRGLPILRDPSPLPPADVVITESTYGDRVHPPLGDTEEVLAGILRESASARGRVVVPAFSVGRTQALLYVTHRLFRDGRAPTMPVFVDSPLSTLATRVVSRHRDVFDAEARSVFAASVAPFHAPWLRFVESQEDSKRLNGLPGPAVILSASGMCESGRILHHLRRTLPESRDVVVLVGFQAEHTLGRRLAEGASVVRILGDEIPVRARVRTMDGWSAHADRNELLHALAPNAARARAAFVVHGEERAAFALADGLRSAGYARVEVPERGETFRL